MNALMTLASESVDCVEMPFKSSDIIAVFVPPMLNFTWMKILLNCCLQSQMLPIKKLILHDILS